MGKYKTHYGLSRTSTTSFFIHHVQRISLAAIVGDACRQLRRSITEVKMKMNLIRQYCNTREYMYVRS